jgi:hypothetical protein
MIDYFHQLTVAPVISNNENDTQLNYLIGIENQITGAIWVMMKQPKLSYNTLTSYFTHRSIHPNSTPSFKNGDGVNFTTNIEHSHDDTNKERWRH